MPHLASVSDILAMSIMSICLLPSAEIDVLLQRKIEASRRGGDLC